MFPSKDAQNATSNQFGDLNLSIIGLGTEYPPHQLDPACLNTLCARHYPTTPAFVPPNCPRTPEQH
jgi:fungal type III polyketide synthase